MKNPLRDAEELFGEKVSTNVYIVNVSSSNKVTLDIPKKELEALLDFGLPLEVWSEEKLDKTNKKIAYYATENNHITTLDVNHYNIDINPSFKNFRHLESFCFQNSNINHFPRYFSKSIRKIYIANNKIEKLPSDEIYNFENLEILCLKGNKIKKLPYEVFDLPKIRLVDLTKNPLKLSEKDIRLIKDFKAAKGIEIACE